MRDTEAYKVVAASVTDALDEMNANVRYGGYVDRDARRRRHEARLKSLGRASLATVSARLPENPECVRAHCAPLTSQCRSEHHAARLGEC